MKFKVCENQLFLDSRMEKKMIFGLFSQSPEQKIFCQNLSKSHI